MSEATKIGDESVELTAQPGPSEKLSADLIGEPKYDSYSPERKGKFLGGITLREFINAIGFGREYWRQFAPYIQSIRGLPEVWQDQKNETPPLEGVPMGILLLLFEFEREYMTGSSWGGGVTVNEPSQAFYDSLNLTSKDLPILGNLGNLGESYALSWFIYHSLSFVFKDKAPRIAKVGIAWLLSSGLVVAMETGIASAGTTPEKGDIWAGVIGPTIFAGIMLLNKEFIKACSEAIKDLKKMIKREKADGFIQGSSETESLALAMATSDESDELTPSESI